MPMGGWPGITRLAAEVAAPGLVGLEIGRSALDPNEIVEWMIERRRIVGWTQIDLVLRGILAGMSDERREATLELAISQLQALGLASAIPDLLISAPFAPESWKLLQSHDGDSQDRYWATVVPGFCRLDRANTSMAVEQLTSRGRARSAFHLVMYQPENVDAVVLKGVLEAIRSGAEPDGPLPYGWHIGNAISAIEAAGKIPRRDLAMLEFAFFRALEHTEHGARNLYAELLTDPALFMECICLVYKPRNGAPEQINDSLKAAGELAWHVLHSCRGIPGKRADGSVDGEELKRWVLEVRRIAATRDRAAVADVTIGGWLSDCEPESDGIWPPSVIGELLDDEQHEDIRRGFYIGVLNNRGVTSRSMEEGGAQERSLAARFRERAAAVVIRYPRVAETLNAVAKHYEHDARRADEEANLRSEGL